MKSFIIAIAVAVLATQSLSAQNKVSDTIKTGKVDSWEYHRFLDSLRSLDSVRLRNYANLKNSWYIEIAGATLIGATFNYERFLDGHPWGLSVHAGLGGAYFSFFNSDYFIGAIPVGASYNVPVSSADKSQMIEFGGTYTFIFNSGGDNGGSRLLSGHVSWRWESVDHKVQFRATLLPFIRNMGSGDTLGLPWIGFSIGKKF